MVDEALLKKKSRWKRVGDIPGIPVGQFEEFKNRRYSLLADYTLVNELAPIFTGIKGRLVYVAFSLLFMAMAAAVIIAGVYLRTPLTVIALVIFILTFLLSPPTLPSRKLINLLSIIGLVLLTTAILTGHFNAVLLLASLVGPIFFVRLYYLLDAGLLLRIAAASEPVFLFLYERGAVAIKDKSTGQIYYCKDAGKVTDFEQD